MFARADRLNLVLIAVLCVINCHRALGFSIRTDCGSRVPQLSNGGHQISHETTKVPYTRKVDIKMHIPEKVSSEVSRASFLSATASAMLIAGTTNAPEARAAEKADLKVSDNHLPDTSATVSKDFTQTLQESISGFTAGGALTITKTFVKYPLDTATVRLQMPGTDYSIRNPLKLFDGSYRGILSPLLFNIPAGGVFFAVKDASKSALKLAGVPKWTRTILSVAAAQFPYWLLRNPSEVVKTRQQAGIPGYGEGVSAVDAFRLVLEDTKSKGNSTGVEGFYSGYWENILYAYPADVIKFVCYDAITQGKKDLAPLEGAIAGALSTATAQFLTTPLDVVRNRIMAGETPVNGDSGASQSQESYIETIKKIAREEGLDGLMSGVSPRVGKAILSGAIQFATYEETKQKINGLFQK